ncbi:MAG TPA: hypothetical protein VHV53_00350 [Solirubrobacterales bacterium]|jgi:hypothetical protein|nr:hypothetical protein [Solirubrobacterales bacterium]
MQALSDEQQLERLGKKVDDGFRELRAEMREEFKSVRTQEADHFRAIYPLVCLMLMTAIFGFAGIILNHV